MNSFIAALIADLDEEALELLATKLRPWLSSGPEAEGPSEGWLRPEAAALYLGVTRKRIHDLKSQGALAADGCDGRTPLFRRETLDEYARFGRSS